MKKNSIHFVTVVTILLLGSMNTTVSAQTPPLSARISIDQSQVLSELSVEINTFKILITQYKSTGITPAERKSLVKKIQELRTKVYLAKVVRPTTVMQPTEAVDPLPATVSTLRIISPNGGEKFTAAGGYYIKWYGHGDGEKYKLEAVSDTSGKKIFIAYFTSSARGGEGSILWTVPYDVEEGQYKIIVTQDGNGRVADKSDISFSVTQIKKEIAVVSPRGGTPWLVGRSYEILWGSTADTAQFKVYLKDGGYGVNYKKLIGTVSYVALYKHAVTANDLARTPSDTWRIMVCDSKDSICGESSPFKITEQNSSVIVPVIVPQYTIAPTPTPSSTPSPQPSYMPVPSLTPSPSPSPIPVVTSQPVETTNPRVVSLSPTSGPVGTTMKLTGSFYTQETNQIIVSCGGNSFTSSVASSDGKTVFVTIPAQYTGLAGRTCDVYHTMDFSNETIKFIVTSPAPSPSPVPAQNSSPVTRAEGDFLANVLNAFFGGWFK